MGPLSFSSLQQLAMTNEQKSEIINMQTIKKEVTLESIFKIVNFLVSQNSRYVSGQIIQVG